jgi:outer membrane biosynthesis protein TonB
VQTPRDSAPSRASCDDRRTGRVRRFADSAVAERNRRAASVPEDASPAATEASRESARVIGSASVVVEFTIPVDGSTKDIVVVESTHPEIFDQAAIEAG